MIIVGAGPTGLALALSLAGHGVRTVVLDGAAGPPPRRLARTCVLAPDAARWVEELPEAGGEATRWTAWRVADRGRTVLREEFPERVAPAHLPQHALHEGLRAAAARHELVRVVTGCRLTGLEEDGARIVARTTGGPEPRWEGRYLVGCDGRRSTVRKLLGVAFPGRTAVERYAVAALRVELAWPGEAGLHRGLPAEEVPGGEVTVRPLAGGHWRLDWPLPPDGGLVTPEGVLDRLHGTLAAWHGGEVPPYDLLDTGVQKCHQRLARSWRSGRAFLAGDAAHLLGALGTQPVAEGLRDAENLAWKLAVACHEGGAERLLDAYEAERRAAVADRLRAVDHALPLVRRRSGVTARLTGRGRGRLALLADAPLGRGTLGAPPAYPHSPLAPRPPRVAPTATPSGAPVADVPVTSLDGDRGRLRDWLGGPLLLVLTAPGAWVWDAKHWLSAGLMPELAAAAAELPLPARLLVTEEYPGAGAHTLLVVRPDGHLAAAVPGADPAGLRACALAVRGTAAETESPTGGQRSAPTA